MKFWNWLVKSSEDPEKTAMTVKGFLHTVAGVALIVSPLFHLHLGQTQLDGAIEVITQIVIIFYSIVSAAVTIVGLIRKLINTFGNSSKPE